MSSIVTKQMEAWSGTFGAEYTQRNFMEVTELDELYARTHGITRSALNAEFIGQLPQESRVLEVGTNIGLQLSRVATCGFTDLWGVELQWGAIDVARQRLPRANIVQGSAFEVPFRDGWFDLVYTSGVLIHLSPSDITTALKEIVRCTRRYVWGFEYWSPEFQEITYHGKDAMLWKADYARLYLERFPSLKLVKERKLQNQVDGTTDTMFLLEKK
jgi:pseudaminic acid biosynthesis-associated methylase